MVPTLLSRALFTRSSGLLANRGKANRNSMIRPCKKIQVSVRYVVSKQPTPGLSSTYTARATDLIHEPLKMFHGTVFHHGIVDFDTINVQICDRRRMGTVVADLDLQVYGGRFSI